MGYDFIDNLQRFSRLANIFGTPQQTGQIGTPPIMPIQPQSMPPPIDNTAGVPFDMSQAQNQQTQYQPQNDILDQYRQALSEMPVREEPNRARKILAGIASLSSVGPAAYDRGAALGIKTDPKEQMAIRDEIAYAPYYKQLGDWKQKVDTLGKASAEETRANTVGLNTFKADTARYRAEVYGWKNTHPNSVIKSDKNGYLIGINPQTNEVEQLTTSDGEPIKSDKLPEADRIQLQIQGQKDVLTQRGKQNAESETQKEANRQKDIAARGSQSRQTKATPSGNAAVTKPETAASHRTAILNNANKARAEHPEWSKWINIDGSNVSITAPKGNSLFSKFSNAPDKATYDQIYNYVFGSSSTSSSNSSNQLTDPDGKVYDTSNWSEDDIAEAKKRGYK